MHAYTDISELAESVPSLKLLLLVLTGATMVCKVVDSCVRIGQALLKCLPAHGLYNP